MRNPLKKLFIVSAVIFPFFYLTLSFCCMWMEGAKPHTMAMAGMASGETFQKGLTVNGDPCQSSQFQCEILTESYRNTKINVDTPKFIFSSSKVTFFSNSFLAENFKQPAFFNYHSPPKVVQNSLPLFLQTSVLRL